MRTPIRIQYTVNDITDTNEFNASIIKDFLGCEFIFRDRIRLISLYKNWLYAGSKHTTIRYKPNGIDLPSNLILPVYEDIYQNHLHEKLISTTYVGKVAIEGITVKKFNDLDNYDAILDGFNNLEELIYALTKIYFPLYNKSLMNDWITIYYVKILE